MPTADQANSFLPLRSPWLHVLLAVASGQSHGYAIRKEVEARSRGQVRLWPATLYGTLDRLCQEGLLSEITEEVDRQGRPRRRYELSPLGIEVVRAETIRLEEIVQHARSIPALEPGRVRT